MSKQSDNQEKGISGFEKLRIWQKAHSLMIEIYEICKKLPYYEHFKIKDQLERSATSVIDKIAEGHTGHHYQDKIKAFHVAKKGSEESQNHIRTLQGKGYITEDQADDIIVRYEEVIRGINGYINWVREKKGTKK
jgi:four helix bundle protein